MHAPCIFFVAAEFDLLYGLELVDECFCLVSGLLDLLLLCELPEGFAGEVFSAKTVVVWPVEHPKTSNYKFSLRVYF